MTNPTTRYGHIEPEHQGKELNYKKAAPGEVEHHGGSFRKYMDNKNKKLQEQFDQQSAVAMAYGYASGLAVSNLFSGVSIMVNGFTTPSQSELKQIMAQHGGNFEIYYHRGRVTHIICSNLTDAKVKIFQRERDPTPVVRPEWVVDSLKAGVLLPLQEYVLWRLRDTPGQRTLSAFQQQPGTTSQAAAKPSSITAALPPSPYKQYAAAAAHSHRQHQSKQNVPSEPAQAVQLLENPTGHANNAAAVDLNTVRQTRDAQTQQQCLQSEPCESADPACALQAANAQTSTAAQHTESNDRANLASKAAATEPSLMPASMPRPVPATPVQPPAPPTSPPAQPSGISDDYKTAYKVAAAARAACDLLRGAPKSSRDDPHFMDSYYKSSRLSFIGRWKARIEALTAAMAGDAPVPQVAHQPLPLMNAFRQGKGEANVQNTERAIIHLDMDCFFASVAGLTDPSFIGKPLAVSHSNSAQGTGEISSANYEARKFGIKASMFIAEAKKRCPHLVVMPYQFEKYEDISEQVYKILLKATACVQPVSCDEAYLDVTGLGSVEDIAAGIRQQIEDATGCTASAGIGPNMLIARLATKEGKPNGQYRIAADQVEGYLLDLAVDELPGVGWNICQKLKEVNISSVRGIRASSKEALQRELGTKTGTQVWAFAHGVDDRIVEPPKARKSVGAECNWGIRFTSDADALTFMDNLAGELSTRMKAAGVKGRTISLKLKRRKTNAPDPPKFMGHGDCDNMSRSITMSRFTDAAAELGTQGKALLKALRVDPTQIRGIGLNVTKLDTDPASAAAKPGSAAPAKGAAPRPSVHDPSTGPWVRFWKDKPQHWGMPSDVGSAAALADAIIAQGVAQQHDRQSTTAAAPATAAGSEASAAAEPLSSMLLAKTSSQDDGNALPSIPDAKVMPSSEDPNRVIEGVNLLLQALPQPVEHSATKAANQQPAPAGHDSAVVPHQAQQASAAAAAAATPNAGCLPGVPAATNAVTGTPPAPVPASALPATASHAAVATPGVAAAAAAVKAAIAVPHGSRAADAIKAAKHKAFNMYSPSKGTLKVLQKPTSNKPSPKKQVALDQMLKQRAEAAAAAANSIATAGNAADKSSGASHAGQQQAPGTKADVNGSRNRQDLEQATDLASDPGFEFQHITAQRAQRMASNQAQLPRVVLPHAAPTLMQSQRFRSLQGRSLSQIDASVFAALPAQHQHELLNNMPKNATRQGSTAGVRPEPAAADAHDDFGFITKLANLQKAAHGEDANADEVSSGPMHHEAADGHRAYQEQGFRLITEQPVNTAAAAAVLHTDTALAQAPVHESSVLSPNHAPPPGQEAPAESPVLEAGNQGKDALLIPLQPADVMQHAGNSPSRRSPSNLTPEHSMPPNPEPAVLPHLSPEHDLLSLPPLRDSLSPEKGIRPAGQLPSDSSQQVQEPQEAHLPQPPSTAAQGGAGLGGSPASADADNAFKAVDAHKRRSPYATDAPAAAAAAAAPADQRLQQLRQPHAAVTSASQQKQVVGDATDADQNSQDLLDENLLEEEIQVDYGDNLDVDLMEEEHAALGMHAMPGHSKPQQAQPKGLHVHVPKQPNSNEPESLRAYDTVASQRPMHTESVAQQAKQGLSNLNPAVAAKRSTAAFPPASQIDASVLDALPLQVRRELEIAYGLVPSRVSPTKPGVKRGRQGGRGLGPIKAQASKKQRLLDPVRANSRQSERLAAHTRMTTAALSFTQVDPAVLSELPQEVRDELTALLPPTNKASHVRTDKHQTANAHFEVLRQNHGFEARHQHQMHHEKDLLSITVCDPLADESAQDLWAALQEALLLLATENDNNTADLDVGSGNHSSHQQSAEGGSTVAKLRAVQGIAVQWVAAHVQHDLEGVHWFLRRLSGFRHQVGMVQQAVASLIQAVQQKVKDVHGATLQTRSFLL